VTVPPGGVGLRFSSAAAGDLLDHVVVLNERGAVI
jgi:hypothetical protein